MALTLAPLRYDKLSISSAPTGTEWRCADAPRYKEATLRTDQPYSRPCFKKCNLNATWNCTQSKAASAWYHQGLQDAAWFYSNELLQALNFDFPTQRYPNKPYYRKFGSDPDITGLPLPRNFQQLGITFVFMDWTDVVWEGIARHEEMAFGHSRVTRYYRALCHRYARKFMRHNYCIPSGCGGRFYRSHLAGIWEVSADKKQHYYTHRPVRWTPHPYPNQWNCLMPQTVVCCDRMQQHGRLPLLPPDYKFQAYVDDETLTRRPCNLPLQTADTPEKFRFRWNHWINGRPLQMRYHDISNIFDNERNFFAACVHYYANSLDGPFRLSIETFVLTAREAIAALSIEHKSRQNLVGADLTNEITEAAYNYSAYNARYGMDDELAEHLIRDFNNANLARVLAAFSNVEFAFFALTKRYATYRLCYPDTNSAAPGVWSSMRAAFRLHRALAAALPALFVRHALPLLGHVITARILAYLGYDRSSSFLAVDCQQDAHIFFRRITDRVSLPALEKQLKRIELQADIEPARLKKDSMSPAPEVALSRRALKRIAREERKKEKQVSESKKPDHVAARTVVKALGMNRGNAPKLDNSDIKRLFRHIKEHKDRNLDIKRATQRMAKINLNALFDSKPIADISVTFNELSANISEALAQISSNTTAATNSFGSAVERLATEAATATNTFDRAGARFEGLSERLESLVSMATSAMKNVTGAIRFTNNKILTARNIMEFAVAFKAYYDFSSEASLFLACASIARMFFDDPLDGVFSLALNLFRRLFPKREAAKIELQGFFPIAALFNIVPDAETIKKFGTLSGKITSIIVLFKHFRTFLQWIVDQLFAKISPDIFQNTTIKRDVEKWIGKVMNRFADGGATKAAREHMYARQIQDLTVEGGILLQRLGQLGDWPAARALQQALQNALGFCKTMLVSANPILDSTAKRPAPITLWVHGPGGVGKSTLTQYLMDASVAQYPTRRPYRRGNDIYHYNPSQEFWNGFHGQQVFFASEAFQIVDTQVRLRAYETWFKTGEDSAWTVNMAMIDHKGTMYCEPELCVWAENATLEETGLSKHVIHPGAALRRMAAEVKVLPTKEAIAAGYFVELPGDAYRYNGPDYNFHPEYLEFHIKRVVAKDDVRKEVWNWDQLVAFVTEGRRRNRESYYAKMKQLQDPKDDKSAFVIANKKIMDMSDDELRATCPPDKDLNQHRTALLVELMNAEYEKNSEEFPVKDFWRLLTAGEDTPSHWMKLRMTLDGFIAPVRAATSALADWKDCAVHLMRKHPKLAAAHAAGVLGALALGSYTAWKWFSSVPEEEFIRVWHEEGGYTDVNKKDITSFTGFLQSNQDRGGYMKRWHGRESKYQAKLRSDAEAAHEFMHWQKDWGEGAGHHGMRLQADDRYSAIERCVCHIVTHPRVSRIYGVRIQGQFLLVNKHYLLVLRKMMADHPDFRITINGQPNSIKDCYWSSTKDFGMMWIEKNIPSVSEALRHFATDHESEVRPGDALYRVVTNERTKATGRLDSESDFDGIPVQLSDIVEYASVGKAGMCGIPVCWAEPSRQEKILGIHSGALGNLSYFTRVSREELERLLAVFDAEPPIPPPEMQGKISVLNGTEDFQVMRLARPDEVCDMPTKSSLIPSYLHGLFPKTSSPAQLSSPSESLLGKALRKMDVPTPQFSKREINGASAYVQVHWPSPRRPPYPVPLHVAWEGVEGDPYRKSLRGATSPGFPYICRGNNQFKKKADMVATGEIHPDIVSRVRSFRDLAIQGAVPEVVFVPMLKDERRPLEKVSSPRMIDNPPIDYILVSRSLFMNPLADFYESHNIWESAVAVSPMSIEWMWMYKRLTKFGTDGFIAGDFSSFDKTLNPDIVARTMELLSRRLILQDHEIRIATAIVKTTVPHLLLVDGKIISVPHGNPSGNPLTVYINTVAVLILVRIAYLNLNPDYELASFEKNVVIKAYGDDNVTGTAPSIRSWFNQRTLTKFFASRGMKYTTPAKDGSDPESFHISEVTFLKRYFREEDGWIYGPLELDVLKEEIMWMRKSSSSKSEFSQQVMTMLQELSLWDQTTFDEISEKVRVACLQADVPFPPVERAAFLERVRNHHVDGLEPNEVYYPGISTAESPLDDPATHLAPIALQCQLLEQRNLPLRNSAFVVGKNCTSKQLQSNFKPYYPSNTPAPAHSTGYIVDAAFDTTSLATPLNAILDALTNSESPIMKALYIIQTEQISMRKRLDSLICSVSSVVTTELDDPDAVRNNSWIRLMEGYQKHMDQVQTIIAKQNMVAALQVKDPTEWTDTDMHLACPLLNVMSQTGKLAPTVNDAADHGMWDLSRRNLVLQTATVAGNVVIDDDSHLLSYSNANWLLRSQLLLDPETIGNVGNVPTYSIPAAVVNALTVESVHQADNARTLSSFVHPNNAGARIGVMEAIASVNAANIITGSTAQYSDSQYISTAFTWDKGTGTYALNSTHHPGKYAIISAVDTVASQIELQADVEDADPLAPVETDDADAVAQVIDDQLAESVDSNVPTGDSDGTPNTVHQITVMDDTDFSDQRGVVRPWKTHNAVQQDEKSWAERARPFATFNWDTTWVAGKILYFNPFSSRFLDPAVICKLRGRTYFNANLKIRVMVNGMKFHAGRMVVTWIARNRMGDMHEAREPTLTYASQFPIQAEVHADAPCTVEINIPFLQQEAELYFNTVEPTNAYIQTNEQNCIGLVAIYAQTDFYSMCTTNGYATVSAWAMIEGLSLSDVYRDDEIDLANIDIPANLATRLQLPPSYPVANQPVWKWTSEVLAPQALPVVPAPPRIQLQGFFQSIIGVVGTVGKIANALGGGGGSSGGSAPAAPAPTPAKPAAKGGRVPVRRPDQVGAATKAEAAKKGPGPVQSIAGKVASVAKPLALIPDIGAAAAGVGTVASAISSIASIFHLDKPRDQTGVTKVLQQWKDFTHADGLEMAPTLGLQTGNEVFGHGQSQPASSTRIADLVSIPAIIDLQVIQPTALSGTHIASFMVHPAEVPCYSKSALHVDSTTLIPGALGVRAPTCSSIIADAFLQWRGEFEYHFSFVCNQFTQMTVLCLWDPTFPESDDLTRPAYGNATNYISKIFQIQGNSEFVFTVPFANRTWSMNSQFDDMRTDALTGRKLNPRTFNGVLHLYVVNAIVNFQCEGNQPVSMVTARRMSSASFYRPTLDAASTLRIYEGANYHVNVLEETVARTEELKRRVRNEGMRRIELQGGLNIGTFFGETVNDIMALCKRETPIAVLHGPRIKMFSFFTDVFPVWPGARVSSLAEGAHSSFAGRIAQNSSKNYLSYFRQLFLTWRGPVTATVVNYTTVDGESTSECNSSFMANYALNYNGAAAAFHELSLIKTPSNEIVSEPVIQDWRRYASDGMVYRPVNVPQMPMTAVMPYYSNQNFLFTPAELAHSYGTVDIGLIPALAIQVQQGSDDVATLMIGAGDTFTFGGFWPPSTTVHTPLNVDVSEITYTP